MPAETNQPASTKNLRRPRPQEPHDALAHHLQESNPTRKPNVPAQRTTYAPAYRGTTSAESLAFTSTRSQWQNLRTRETASGPSVSPSNHARPSLPAPSPPLFFLSAADSQTLTNALLPTPASNNHRSLSTGHHGENIRPCLGARSHWVSTSSVHLVTVCRVG